MSRNSTRATTCPRTRDECLYENSSSSGVSHARSVRPDHLHALDDVGPVPAVGARVHAHAPARRARDRACELHPSEARGPRPVQADGVRRRRRRPSAACPSISTVASSPDSRSDKAVDARVRREHVRPEPDDEDGQGRFTRPREQALELGEPLGSPEVERRAADAHGRQPREWNVLLEPGGNCLWMSCHSSGPLPSPTRSSFAATLISGAGRGSAPGERIDRRAPGTLSRRARRG